jgi:ORF6N domain
MQAEEVDIVVSQNVTPSLKRLSGILLYRKGLKMEGLVTQEAIEGRIFQIRGKKVMLDIDLAKLYQVPTKVLNQAVKRNMKRFPGDFMFKLTETETKEVVTDCDHLSTLRFSPYFPYAFTEQGVAMLSSVLNSERAVLANIQIMRAFVSIRRVAITYSGLKRKIEKMENKYDAQFSIVFEAIKKLLEPPPPPPKRRIGFHHD